MKIRFERAVTACGFAIALAVAIAAPARAQWLSYPTAGMPRKPDGTPDLAAPAPLNQGRPSLAGLWSLEPKCPPAGCAQDVTDYVGGPEFRNFGADLPDGPPYQPWAAALVAERKAALGKDDPVAACRPGGAMRILTFPPPRKILELPGLVVILSERDVTFRQIFTDGRPLPDDPEPTWNGYSVGRWDGDALVVQTVGLHDDTWLDRNGSPLTAAAKITERYRRLSYGRLDIEVTIDDPKAYTKPWTVTLSQIFEPDTELLDYHCMDVYLHDAERH
jgi:hypothetical protein